MLKRQRSAAPECWASCAHLAHRIRCVLPPTNAADGEFVLYWTHSALRCAENPALDAALLLAHTLGLPVVVVGLMRTDHAHATLRRCHFEYSGLKSLREEYAKRDLTMILGAGMESKALLEHLARRAAAVVTEEMPVDPHRRWLRDLSAAIGTGTLQAGMWAVDASCLVPMQRVGRAYESARAFRDATAAARRATLAGLVAYGVLDRSPPALVVPNFVPANLPTAALVSAHDDRGIAELCPAADPTVPCIPGSPPASGPSAARQRWADYVRRGLKKYPSRRNDPTDLDGVSRCSHFHHYGMLSPFAVAADAAAASSDKFLDEFLVWRELSYSWCFYRYPNHTGLHAMPQWAQRSLLAHARDARPKVLPASELANARSGDRVWDACQRSLLLRGELHNNLRMSWGKALLQWTASPEDAVHLAQSLNDRYALDGGDPCSYTGIGWCFGLFDGPKSEQRVIGVVRSRPTSKHTSQLPRLEQQLTFLASVMRLPEQHLPVATPAESAPHAVLAAPSAIAGAGAGAVVPHVGATPSTSSVSVALATKGGERAAGMPLGSGGVTLTAEQRERMERNRQAALAKRAGGQQMTAPTIAPPSSPARSLASLASMYNGHAAQVLETIGSPAKRSAEP